MFAPGSASVKSSLAPPGDKFWTRTAWIAVASSLVIKQVVSGWQGKRFVFRRSRHRGPIRSRESDGVEVSIGVMGGFRNRAFGAECYSIRTGSHAAPRGPPTLGVLGRARNIP